MFKLSSLWYSVAVTLVNEYSWPVLAASPFLQGRVGKKRRILKTLQGKWVSSGIIPGNPNGVYINETTGLYLS